MGYQECAKEIVSILLNNLDPEYYVRSTGSPKLDFFFYEDLEYSRVAIKAACVHLVCKNVICHYKMMDNTVNIIFTNPSHLLMFYNDYEFPQLKDPNDRVWTLSSCNLDNKNNADLYLTPP